MPRDLPIGNGNILIAFDENALLREFYFPHVGEENHTKGEVFRFGVWIDGQFSWIGDDWKITKKYLMDTLVTDVLFEGYELTIQINDAVDFEENIYVRKITLKNLQDKPRDVRLFLCCDFHIYGNEIGDTAAFRPENLSLVHYKGRRYFLINVFANHKVGIDLYATGHKETSSEIGTWKDAEDGVLSGNPIAQGSVDSVIGIPLTLIPFGEEVCYSWIAAGKNWDEVKTLNDFVKKKGPWQLLQRTSDYWKLWANKDNLDLSLLPPDVATLYKRSLLIARTQINHCGSIIAANDSDATYFNRDTYSYMWPRDGALIAHSLDLAGYETSRSFYCFCAKILEKGGYFLHKYTPTGALASSWHPWVKENKAQLPIQEDETALVLWSLWHHYTIFKDLEFIRSLYTPLIKKCADFLMNYRDRKTDLPLPSFDLWEEREGVLTFTVSAVYGGLTAAANFIDLFGEKSLAEEIRNGARKLREGMDRFLYLEKEKRFARMVSFKKDGSIEVDATIDASLYGIFAFGAYPVDDLKVQNTMKQVIETLESGGGIARYENDSYYRQSDQSNPWFICTLWVAQYYIANHELSKALSLLEWVASHALPSGVLAEQIDPVSGKPISVSPLTWSHGTYIIAVQEYLAKVRPKTIEESI